MTYTGTIHEGAKETVSARGRERPALHDTGRWETGQPPNHPGSQHTRGKAQRRDTASGVSIRRRQVNNWTEVYEAAGQLTTGGPVTYTGAIREGADRKAVVVRGRRQ